jgi:hypothetical protein
MCDIVGTNTNHFEDTKDEANNISTFCTTESGGLPLMQVRI